MNGANAAPLYQFLRSQKGGGVLGDSIKWNFGKFLVDKEGKVVERYAPTTTPASIGVSNILLSSLAFSTDENADMNALHQRL